MPSEPYLFICVLELMAIAIREDQILEGIKEPNSKKSDKISLFADDSAMCISDLEKQTIQGRARIEDYEKATGGKLHDTKTKIMKIGATKSNERSQEELGVEYEMMENDAVEKYLGDLIGNYVGEDQRFGERLAQMKKTGEAWNRHNIGIFGRAIVANTLLMSKIMYRTNVNPVSKTIRKQIRNIISRFIWKQGRERVRWEVLLGKESTGRH